MLKKFVRTFFLYYFASVCNIIINLLNFLIKSCRGGVEDNELWAEHFGEAQQQQKLSFQSFFILQHQHNLPLHSLQCAVLPFSHILNYWCNDKNLFQQNQPCVECWFVWCMWRSHPVNFVCRLYFIVSWIVFVTHCSLSPFDTVFLLVVVAVNYSICSWIHKKSFQVTKFYLTELNGEEKLFVSVSEFL